MVLDVRVARICTLAACLLLVTPCSAESVADRVRLGFEGGIVEHRAITASAEGAEDASVNDTAVGLGTTAFGPVVGYGASDGFVITGRLSLISQVRRWENGVVPDSSVNGFGLFATGEFLFDGDSTRPFVGPIIGYEGTSTESRGVDATSSFLVAGIAAGVHVFLTPSFSIDPSAMLAYATGKTESGGAAADLTGAVIGVRLGLSGWLGGESAVTTVPVTAAGEPDATVHDESVPFAPGALLPPPGGSMSGGRVTILLPRQGRLILAPGDSTGAGFRYITPSEAPNAACPKMAFRRGETEEPLTITRVATEEQGSSSVLVVEGVATPSALAFAGATGAVDLMACDRAIKLRQGARNWVRHFIEASEHP